MVINAARYGYAYGTDIFAVLDEKRPERVRARMAALEVYVSDERIRWGVKD